MNDRSEIKTCQTASAAVRGSTPLRERERQTFDNQPQNRWPQELDRTFRESNKLTGKWIMIVNLYGRYAELPFFLFRRSRTFPFNCDWSGATLSVPTEGRLFFNLRNDAFNFVCAGGLIKGKLNTWTYATGGHKSTAESLLLLMVDEFSAVKIWEITRWWCWAEALTFKSLGLTYTKWFCYPLNFLRSVLPLIAGPSLQQPYEEGQGLESTPRWCSPSSLETSWWEPLNLSSIVVL